MLPRIALSLFIALLGLGCQPPRCPHARMTPGATSSTMGWLDANRPRVNVAFSGASHIALLDTGFPRTTVFENDAFFAVNAPGVTLGAATVGPLQPAMGFQPDPDIDFIVGADALSYAPLVFDARAAQTRVDLDFTPGAGVAPLARWSTGLCQGDERSNGPEGPDLLLVDADLDGHPLTLAIDTGADFTFVRQDAVPDLASRPTLSGLPVRTAFAGSFATTVTRARALSVGGQASLDAPVLVSPLWDSGLDAFMQRFRDPPPRLDGALGRSFLREFEVDLTLGEDAETGRAIGLTRFDTQTHWTRDFVGVGIATTRSDGPLGLRVGALLSVSPARDAGLQVGDVIVTVNGDFAPGVPQPWGRPGDLVHLQYVRQGVTVDVDVPIADLLPDP